MKALKKTTNEPESRESLFGAALLSASIGAILFYLTRKYYTVSFAYDSGLLFRGAWALEPLISLPWMTIVGVIVGRSFGKSVKSVFGIIGALSVACVVYLSFKMANPNYYYGYDVRVLIYSYLLPAVACFMIGAALSSEHRRVHEGRDAAIMMGGAIIALAIYLVCEYFLHGYTSPLSRHASGIGMMMLYLLSSMGALVASLCIAGFCRSEVVARLTRPLLVRILLGALCVFASLWQVALIFLIDRWNWPMLSVWMVSPLVVIAVAGIIRLAHVR